MTKAINSKPVVLVVDDSRLMRVAARKILNNDFDILEAGDGEQAWDTLQNNNHISLVMSDLSMPNLDGLSLLKRIRRAGEPHLRALPVIIVTGAEDDDSSKQIALAAGASDFITKPFESVQLLTRIRSQAEQQRTRPVVKSSEADRQWLEPHSRVDVLTGLTNEQDIVDHIEKGMSYALRHGTELSLLLVQVEKYKIMFLRRGKQTAEEVLRHMAQLLCRGRRQEDNVARISLDTFGILLPSADTSSARRIAEHLLVTIRAHDFEVNGENIPTTASIAVVSPMISTGTEAAAGLKEAREKLQLAYLAGGDCIQYDRVNRIDSSIPGTSARSTATAASVTDVENALQILTAGDRLDTDTVPLVRAIMPLLHAWNQSHNNRYSTLIESLEVALNSDNRHYPLQIPVDVI